MDGGAVVVEQAETAFPAATTIRMLAARCAATACSSVPGEQSSLGGQHQEFVVMSGAFEGSPCAVVPPTGYGAKKKSMHSMYVAGVPFPWSMLRHAMNV